MVSRTKMTTKGCKTSRYTFSLRTLVWCICLFASIMLVVPQQVYARSLASIPGGDVGDPAIRAVDIAQPAVVRIFTSISGHLTVHFSATTDVSFPQQSRGYPLEFSGTGMFISSQGDILTAGHVVQPPQSLVLNPALYQEAAKDVASYMNQNGGAAPVSPDEVVQQLTNAQLQSTATYDAPIMEVFQSTYYAGNFTAADLNSVPSSFRATVDKVKAQSPFDQEDVAIIHVPMTDTPSIALGNSDEVQPQDKLTVIGFPGNADVSLKPQDLLTPSVSSVSVSAKKTSANGAPLLQIDGNITHGNSGGPALNSQGAVVGVVSFGPDTGGNTSFLQASSSALQLAQSIKLDMTPGSFENSWGQAFNDYAATTPGHWHKAQQEFSQLIQKYPQFQAVQQYLTYAQQQAQTESVNSVAATPTQAQNTGTAPNISSSTSSGLPAWEIWVGGIVLALVLGTSVFAVSVRKRKYKTVFEPGVMDSKKPPTVIAPKSSQSPVIKSQAPVSGGTGDSTLSLKVWPCGHMNQANARFCSICGESAPTVTRQTKL